MLRSRPARSTCQLLCKMSAERAYNVLFLCTGNSARSILAESLLNHWCKDKFRAFSAGIFPKGEVHPMAIELLKRMNLPAEGFCSKSWDEFARVFQPFVDVHGRSWKRCAKRIRTPDPRITNSEIFGVSHINQCLANAKRGLSL
jgi:hypothetical protein